MRRAVPRAPVPAVVRLDERGRLCVPGTSVPVPPSRVADHLARTLRVPERATDLYLYVHGWQTSPDSAVRAASRLMGLARRLAAARPSPYGGLSGGFRPWCVVVCWPSSSLPSLGGYRRIRDRAHAMSAPGTGHAAHVIGHLLGYLDTHRADPAAPAVLANRNGQYLHLLGHSFGGRFLCEAVQWAAERPDVPRVLGWSNPGDPRRPFTVDSALVFQMAAPRDSFDTLFPALFRTDGAPAAPLRGPLVLTRSRWDRATGFWHLRAESAPGIGHSGVGTAPVPQFSTRLLPVCEPYAHHTLDHRLVTVNADWRFTGSRTTRLLPSGAHSDFLHEESAHLLLTLASFSR
ncbi:alpha/beta hydrolase [Streptomyces sp. RFCAC02]|uniref:alpha/beta hydrolase n=1 Tax=Streptomyces sp. RFCAC02 TaxID=2499143 RepID=UPI0019D2C764|nr:alpha/beta hydrolase [Streptomyces sp. RFCAC02]